MIEQIKQVVRRHWPRLRLRTILLLTFLFVAALPGFGALFLRVYENLLVRQTEAELVAQSAALAAAAAVAWPGAHPRPLPQQPVPQPPSIDLRMTHILPERSEPQPSAGPEDRATLAWGDHLRPVLQLTARTTLASILLLDANGRILVGSQAGASYADLPEARSALDGEPATMRRGRSRAAEARCRPPRPRLPSRSRHSTATSA